MAAAESNFRGPRWVASHDTRTTMRAWTFSTDHASPKIRENTKGHLETKKATVSRKKLSISYGPIRQRNVNQGERVRPFAIALSRTERPLSPVVDSIAGSCPIPRESHRLSPHFTPRIPSSVPVSIDDFDYNFGDI